MDEKSSRPNSETWFCVGLASSFRDISESSATTNGKSKINDTTGKTNGENNDLAPCRIFESSKSLENPYEVNSDEAAASVGLKEQILIFRYRGKFHAVDHKCPHRSYALSRGTIHDIEDFGIVLSAGITCPKHGWSFDIHTGESDRGPYQLPVHEVQLRKRPQEAPSGDDKEAAEEVWVKWKV